MQQISDDQLARLEQAAGAGDVSIQYLLGQMFENGLGVPQNLDKAAKFYQKAADASHVLAQNDLGWMYAEGRGVEKNDAEAAKWWNKAAAQNDSRALTYVRGTQSPISASDLQDFVKGSMLNSIKEEISEWAFRNIKIAITFISIAGVLGIGGAGLYIFKEITSYSKEITNTARDEINLKIAQESTNIDRIVEEAQETLVQIRKMARDAEASLREAQRAEEQSQLLLDKRSRDLEAYRPPTADN